MSGRQDDRWSRRATPLVFLGLAAPTLAQLLQGDLGLDEGALRCLVAVLAAVLGMQVLSGVIGHYTQAQVAPEPVQEADPSAAARPEVHLPLARRASDPVPATSS